MLSVHVVHVVFYMLPLFTTDSFGCVNKYAIMQITHIQSKSNSTPPSGAAQDKCLQFHDWFYPVVCLERSCLHWSVNQVIFQPVLENKEPVTWAETHASNLSGGPDYGVI